MGIAQSLQQQHSSSMSKQLRRLACVASVMTRYLPILQPWVAYTWLSTEPLFQTPYVVKLLENVATKNLIVKRY
jgi:hypothetical protein